MNTPLLIPYQDKLETSRLTTRFLTENDIGAWIEYCTDPVATIYTSIPGKTPEEMAQMYVQFSLDRYNAGTLGLQALITKDTGDFIGMCGLLVQELCGKNEIEVGYHLLRRFWGYGYATEAAQMFRDYGFMHSNTHSITSIIHPQNTPSKSVALRNGMHLSERNVPFRKKAYDVYRITRDGWNHVNDT